MVLPYWETQRFYDLTPQAKVTAHAPVHVLFYREAMEPGRAFPVDVTTVLETFYKRGMTGWSGSSKEIFQEALGSTPLNESQLKVKFLN